jgi:hypothetical protein
MAPYEYEGYWVVRQKQIDPFEGVSLRKDNNFEFVRPVRGYVDDFGQGGRCAHRGATLHNPESSTGRRMIREELKEERERQALARLGEPLHLDRLMPDDPGWIVHYEILDRHAITAMYETYYRIIDIIKESAKKAVQYRVEDNCCTVLFIPHYGLIDIADNCTCKFYQEKISDKEC